MKILFDFQDMSGGAPRSQLTHMLAMQQLGHEVVATISKDAEVLRGLINCIKVIEIDRFQVQKPFHNLTVLRQWIHALKAENPDIIHANRTTQSRFLGVASDWVGIPLVFAQAGGEAKLVNLRPLLGKTAICYSLENKKTFIESGFKQDAIHVIANRIHAIEELGFISNLSTYPKNVLLTGNIKKGTAIGLLTFLKNFEFAGLNLESEFLLQIAGKDITPNKAYHDQIIDQIVKTNIALAGSGKVEHLGWVDDIVNIQDAADICIGKGRSIIQPAISGKVCFVLAETGKLTRVSAETFDSLYEYNFSGRGNQRDDSLEFFNILSGASAWHNAQQDAAVVQPRILEAYLAEGAKDKLLAAYSYAFANQERKSNKPKAFVRFTQIYREWLGSKFIRNKT